MEHRQCLRRAKGMWSGLADGRSPGASSGSRTYPRVSCYSGLVSGGQYVQRINSRCTICRCIGGYKRGFGNRIRVQRRHLTSQTAGRGVLRSRCTGAIDSGRHLATPGYAVESNINRHPVFANDGPHNRRTGGEVNPFVGRRETAIEEPCIWAPVIPTPR